MTLTRILVPVDFGPASQAALEYARGLAEPTGATIHLLHVVDDIAARFIEFPYAQFGLAQETLQESAREQLAAVARRADVGATRLRTAVLVSTAPASAIAGYAADEHIDLIVMGTHGRAPVTRMFLGSVADRLVRTAPCPVLTVREAKTGAPRPTVDEHETAPLTT